MLFLCLVTMLGLATADPSSLCDSDCPPDWKSVEGDCVMFMYGWEEDMARQVCRGLKAEFSEFFISRSDSDSATRHSLPVCLLRRETQAPDDSEEERQCDSEPCPVPGFLITGGGPDSSYKKAELFNPASGNSCPVQDLQENRESHSSCGGLVCGGVSSSSSEQSCERINGTEVSPLPSLTLRQERLGHLCWSLTDAKIMLLGGYLSSTTTEIVSGSSSSEVFTLPYKTIDACGIELGDHYVVTGGYDYTAPEGALNTVAKYSQSGLVDYLPSLNTRRYNHACSSFISDSGDTVLMVTGGEHYPGGTFTRLDSTEILVDIPGRSWRTLTTARLPSPRSWLRAGTANNVVFVFGGQDGSSELNTILSFNKAEESWQPAGQMSVKRTGHAVEKIEDIGQHCP